MLLLFSYGSSNIYRIIERSEIHSRASGDAEWTFATPPGNEKNGTLVHSMLDGLEGSAFAPC